MRFAAFLATCALAAPAFAAGPTIEHVAIVLTVEGAEIPVHATIQSPGGVADARVFWRVEGDRTFSQAPLVQDGLDTFGTLLRPKPGAGAVEYYLSACDA